MNNVRGGMKPLPGVFLLDKYKTRLIKLTKLAELWLNYGAELLEIN